jgi:hypothetical protein
LCDLETLIIRWHGPDVGCWAIEEGEGHEEEEEEEEEGVVFE